MLCHFSLNNTLSIAWGMPEFYYSETKHRQRFQPVVPRPLHSAEMDKHLEVSHSWQDRSIFFSHDELLDDKFRVVFPHRRSQFP